VRYSFFIQTAMVLTVFSAAFCSAEPLDWQRLHEEADAMSVGEAKGRVLEKPFLAEDLYKLGLVYLNAHKDIDAGEVFRRGLERMPGSFEFRWGLAEVSRRQHKLDESEPVLEELVEKHPGFVPPYISLAYVRYTRMDFAGCVSLAYKVLEIGRDNVDISNYTRAYLLVGGGRGMLAHYGGPISKLANGRAVLPYLKKAERLQPDSPAVLFGLGSFYFLAPGIAGGNRAKARGYLEQAVARDPLFADAYVRLAQVYKAEGELKKYEECIAKAEQIDPQNALLLDMESSECKFICISLER